VRAGEIERERERARERDREGERARESKREREFTRNDTGERKMACAAMKSTVCLFGIVRLLYVHDEGHD
jgi:hypothetical protein